MISPPLYNIELLIKKMVKQTFSANQVISMVFDTPAIAGDRDEFEGYVDDEEISAVSAEHHFFSKPDTQRGIFFQVT